MNFMDVFNRAPKCPVCGKPTERVAPLSIVDSDLYECESCKAVFKIRVIQK